MELPALLSLPRPPKKIGKVCKGLEGVRVAPPEGLGDAVERLLIVRRRRPEEQVIAGVGGMWTGMPVSFRPKSTNLHTFKEDEPASRPVIHRQAGKCNARSSLPRLGPHSQPLILYCGAAVSLGVRAGHYCARGGLK